MPNPQNKTMHIEASTVKKGKKLTAVASTESEDRVGDSLKAEDWDFENFKKNPVLLAGHDHRPQYTIGIAKDVRVENKKLLFEPVFHTLTPLAKQIKAMFESNPPILKTWSVGFIPRALMQNDKGEKLGKNELLEVSAVAVPANPEALTEAKNYSGETVKKVENWIEDKKEEVEETEIEETKEEPKVSEEKQKEDTKDKKEIKEKTETIDESKSDKPSTEEKSPACRMKGESKEDCVSRKIPEIIDEGYDQEQASAMAYSMCDKACPEKENEEKPKKKPKKDMETVLKEGRVLSAKNRSLVKSAVETNKKVITALEELLEATNPVGAEENGESETPEKAVSRNSNVTSKGRNGQGRVTPVKKINTGKIVDQALRNIAASVSKARYELNKDKK